MKVSVRHVETEVNNKHLIFASCWVFFSLHKKDKVTFLRALLGGFCNKEDASFFY